MNKFSVYLLGLLLIAQSCRIFQPGGTGKDDRKIEVNFVQINDVYEIAPLSGGREGGMARVATLKKQYLKKNPNTFLVIAGDFLSPSVYNSMQYMGRPIRGKQMVEAMNVAGMDLAIFGNHEFDIKENELLERIEESQFRWISSNAFHKKNNVVGPFTKNGSPITEAFTMEVEDKDGTTATIGFFGIVLPFNKAAYVSYTDPLTAAKEMYALLSKSCDAVVAITHQSMEEDERLAAEIPGLALIIGGHEHDQRFKKVGGIYITKALANAKSAYVLNLRINKKKGSNKVSPKLEMLDESVALDSATTEIVHKWSLVAEKNYSTLGFDAKKIMMTRGEPLEGRETEVRRTSTNLTRLVVAAMMNAAPEADVALLNGGSIRVDDVLPMPVTQYDILRTLPFGGAIKEADMKGVLLVKTLDAGRKNITIGGFLHYNEDVRFDESSGRWLINNQPIDLSKTYRVAMAEFLFTGMEANLDFLTPKNPDVVKVYDTQKPSSAMADIRMAVVQYLEKNAERFR